MRPRKYPLDPLARLREKQVGDAAKLLSDAIRARHQAERAEGAALAMRDDAEEDALRLEQREQAALERGELRAEDLARAAAWSTRVDAERTELERALAKAAQGTLAAHGSERRAQDVVARARADAEVLERDRAKWTEAGRKKDEAAEEETVAEAFRGKTT
jgi:hypothetical protein